MTYTYLALGDSYTIGEQVTLAESFPYQTVQRFRRNQITNVSFVAPEIVAKTGWSTDELSAAVNDTVFLKKYDVVSLLIGVNNQYRGRSASEFETEFTQLLEKAFELAGGNHKRVFVLSIPDWGITPFAQGKDQHKISMEIDRFNNTCQRVAEDYRATFIDITTSQRTDGTRADFLAPDGLHPSGNEYAKWAGKLQLAINANLFESHSA